MALRDRLAAHAQRAIDEPFAWGRSDCVTFMMDWVLAETGRDPMKEFRGAYHDEAEAVAIWSTRRTNLAVMVMRAMRGEGLARASIPAPGDVAVLAAPGLMTCGIRAGDGYLRRSDRGLGFLASPRVLMAWAIGEA